MIPKTFHRVWFPADERDVIPPKFEAFWTDLQAMHPDWEFVTHDDPDATEEWLVNADLFRRTRQAAADDPARFKDFAYGSLPDIVRYEVCYRFGGVYIDVDFEPIKPFDDLIARDMPFIGWESFDYVCCAVMGGPAGHPAFADLIENLDEHASKNWDLPAVDRTGPRFITDRWVARDDVLRLPPAVFYPVCWNEAHRLGGPYPEATIAVHHWNAGWIPGKDKRPKPAAPGRPDPTVAVLIPWRGGDPDRELAFAAILDRWDASGWEVFVGDSPADLPFNRSAAINAAAEEAGDWDVAVIVDADTWDNVTSCRKAASAVSRGGGAIVPWNVRYKLAQAGTAQFLAQGRKAVGAKDLDPDDPTRVSGVPAHKRGGAIVVGREAWDSVGGFDEGFTEWGHEDRAFRLAVATLARGGLKELPAKVWHLWHPLADANRKGSDKGRERFERYEQANGNPAAMEALLRDLGMKKPPTPSTQLVE